MVKNLEYRNTASTQRYLILAQDLVTATMWMRNGEKWVGYQLRHPHASIV